jgi:hypothetical protein
MRGREDLATAAGSEALGRAGSVRRDGDRIQRVNFIDRGLFTITGGYDVKGLKKAITRCWVAVSNRLGNDPIRIDPGSILDRITKNRKNRSESS